MHKIISIIKSRVGFVAIETIVIAGLMIGLGMTGVKQLYIAGTDNLDVAVKNVNSIVEVKLQNE